MDFGLDAFISAFIQQHPTYAKWFVAAGLILGGLAAVGNVGLLVLKVFGKDGGKAGAILRKALTITTDLHSFFSKLPVPVQTAAKTAVIFLALGVGLFAGSRAFAGGPEISHGPTASLIQFRLGLPNPTQLGAGLGYQVDFGFFPKGFSSDFPILGGKIWDLLDLNAGAIGSLVPGSSAAGQVASLAPFLGVGAFNGIVSASVALDALGSYGGFLNGKVTQQNVSILLHSGIKFDFGPNGITIGGESAPKRGATFYAH